MTCRRISNLDNALSHMVFKTRLYLRVLKVYKHKRNSFLVGEKLVAHLPPSLFVLFSVACNIFH